MKSKENLKTIDLASLAKVLGGIPAGAGSAKPGTVITQAAFSSFFHS
jgi:hypothetical protein